MEAFDISSFMIVFRETLEAALIIAIIWTFLVKTGETRYVQHVLIGAAAAMAASFIVAFIFEATLGAFEGRAAEIFEGVISLLAVIVLTYMVIWMHQQASKIRSSLEMQVASALQKQDIGALIALPFFAVLREGAETVLFLKAAAYQTGGVISFFGGMLGFCVAILLVSVVFWIGKRIPLRPFFLVTEIFLILIAGGLLAYGIHELEEAGWIHGIISPVWNINHVLNEKSGVGAFLKAIFGYNGNPSLTEVLAYSTYLSALFGFLYFFKPSKRDLATAGVGAVNSA